MLRSIERLQEAHAARAVGPALSLRAQSLSGRDAMLEAVRQRNAVLDWLFYDLGALRPEEAKLLSPWLAAEGTILIVPPADAGVLQVCQSVADFLSKGGGSVRALAVAGVGSSALGAAALARNAADAIGKPVAAVVSGYGLADVATEALGGFFWFGALNSMRHSFEWMDRLGTWYGLRNALSSVGLVDDALVRDSSDTRAVYELLTDPRVDFDVLLGHSKGNLVISEALYALNNDDRPKMRVLGAKWHIVTLSAVIAMPPTCKNVWDVIGSLDGFGAVNSRSDIEPDEVVVNSGHHTNTEIPLHLPVKAVLTDLRARGRLGRI